MWIVMAGGSTNNNATKHEQQKYHAQMPAKQHDMCLMWIVNAQNAGSALSHCKFMHNTSFMEYLSICKINLVIHYCVLILYAVIVLWNLHTGYISNDVRL